MMRKLLIPLLALVMISPAHAEKLTFDHRIYPPLEAVINSGRDEMVRFDDSNPKYLVDRIAIQGKSADDWTEALDIIVRLRARRMSTPADWAQEIQRRARSRCPSEFTTLAQDAISLTFERRSTGCPAGTAQTGLYRIVAGRSSLFMLNAMIVGDVSEQTRQQWLELLRSAHLD